MKLRTRIALAVSVLFVLMSLLVHFTVIQQYQGHLKAAILNQQSSLVAQLAQRLDQDIVQARDALRADTRLVTPSLLADPKEARSFLANRRSLRTIFDYRLFLFDDEGRLVAHSGDTLYPAGADFSSVPYVQVALQNKSSTVSAPYLSAATYHPVVMFVEPIRGKEGSLQGLFAAGLDLMKDNMISRLSGFRVGDEGYVAVFSQAGTVIAHTDHESILAGFDHQAFADATGHTDPTVEMEDYRGIPVLMTRQPIESTGWLAAASYPLDELYAPVRTVRCAVYPILVAVTLLAIVLSWLLAGYLTRNLSRLAQEVRRTGSDFSAATSLLSDNPPPSGDEAGELWLAIRHMLTALKDSEQDLHRMSIELTRAEEQERRKIAEDLHDSIVQTLSLANLRLSQLRTNQTDEGLAEVKAHVENAIHEMRGLIFDLSPPVLDQLGLVAAFEWYKETFEEHYRLVLHLELPGEAPFLSQDANTALFRSARELLINAAKHAGVSEIRLRMTVSPERLCIAVEDRGSGFDPVRIRFGQQRSGGFGLLRMRERMRSLGGNMEIVSAPGKGTLVTLCLPLEIS